MMYEQSLADPARRPLCRRTAGRTVAVRSVVPEPEKRAPATRTTNALAGWANGAERGSGAVSKRAYAQTSHVSNPSAVHRPEDV